MNSRQVFLLFISLALVVSIISMNDGDGSKELSKEYVYTNLSKYVEDNITNNEIFPNDVEIPINPPAFTYATNNAEIEIMQEFDNMGSNDSKDKFKHLSGMDYVKFVANIFLISTEFQGKARINEAPKNGFINIYFLDKDEANLSQHFENNCTFIGYYRAIICDAKFIKDTIARLNAIEKIYNVAILTPDKSIDESIDLSVDHESQRLIVNLLKANFITWILGHEIGHAINHYEYVVNKNEKLHFDLDYNEKEREADSYVATTILLSEGEASSFKTMLSEFIHQEYRSSYIKNMKVLSPEDMRNIEKRDFPLRNNLDVQVSKYQVPLLLRALNIMNLLIEIQPSIDGTGHYDKIVENIKIQQSAL